MKEREVIKVDTKDGVVEILNKEHKEHEEVVNEVTTDLNALAEDFLKKYNVKQMLNVVYIPTPEGESELSVIKGTMSLENTVAAILGIVEGLPEALKLAITISLMNNMEVSGHYR